MRRLLLTFSIALLLAVPVAASAAVNPERNAGALTASMSTPSVPIASAAFSLYPNTDPVLGTSTGVANAPLTDFPINGSTFAILATGDAQNADPADSGPDSLNAAAPVIRGDAYDVTTLRVDIDVPSNANCLSLGFRFFTDEAAGATYNDGFVAELGSSTWSVDAATNQISAPNNFAFDQNGDPLSVNSPGAASFTAAGAAGTGYSIGTQRLSAARAVAPGRSVLFLSVFDVQDRIVGTAAFVDRLTLLATEPGGCTAGLTNDDAAPAVTLGVAGSSADDTTPRLSGGAGDAPGDSATVLARVYAGGAVSGTPVQTLSATRNGTSWAVDAGPLAPGTYTAQAEQADVAGNIGRSGAVTFNVAAPPVVQVLQNQEAPPAPVLGETVVAGAVSGTVKIKLKNGKFRTLGANESIPLGSTVDATKGKVRVTAAAGAGGAVQTADFYKGAFVITQTGGKKKPITQLALSGKLSCPRRVKGNKASTSAKKKVRRLWGDGKGRFRTKGKHGAATVRGTKWLTEDRCDSTRISVARGSVVVRDFAKRKNKVVKKGKSYVARAKTKSKGK